MNLSDNLNNVLNNTLDLANNLSKMQQKFMESNLYGIFDGVLNIGIRAALPDLIEDDIINIKDNIMQNGIVDGVNEIVNNIKSFGKSTFGLITGNFENISQIQTAVKSGGVLDKISKIFDFALDKAKEKGLISNTMKNTLKSQKNSIAKNIKNNISSNLEDQVKYFEKIDEYNNKWQECFKNKDLKGMKNANKNIQKYLKKVLPIESTLNSARKIETLEKLIENKGNFELNKEELELVEALNS